MSGDGIVAIPEGDPSALGNGSRKHKLPDRVIDDVVDAAHQSMAIDGKGIAAGIDKRIRKGDAGDALGSRELEFPFAAHG